MPLAELFADVRTQIVRARDRDAVLRAAAELLACREAGADALFAGLRTREAIGSTAIGHGIAIPHGRLESLSVPRGALLRLQSPVDFKAGDGQPVDLVFAMAVPAHYTQEHLLLLSALAARFSDAGFRDALHRAPDADALRALLTDHPPNHESAAA